MSSRQTFSERENEVTDCLMQGLSNQQIALALGISTRTVEYHLSHVYAKLEVGSRTEAILKLSEERLREPLGEAASRNLRESAIDKTGFLQDNAGKAFTLRRNPLKTLIYLLAGLMVMSVLLIALNFIRPGSTPEAAVQVEQASTTPTAEQPSTTPTATPTPSAREQNIAEVQRLAAEYDRAVQEELQHGSYETRTDPQTGEEIILFQDASRERLFLLYDELNEQMQDLLNQYKALYIAEVQPTPFPTQVSAAANEAYFQELVDQYPAFFEQVLANGPVVRVYDPDDGRYYERIIGDAYAQSEIMMAAMDALRNAPQMALIDQEAEITLIREAIRDPDAQLSFEAIQPLANAPWHSAAVYSDASGSFNYWVDIETGRLAMIEPLIRRDVSAFESKGVDELRAAAEQFAAANSPRFEEIKGSALHEEGYKGDIYFFRWDTRGQDWSGTDWAMMPPFLQVGMLADGQVFTYINTLDLYE